MNIETICIVKQAGIIMKNLVFVSLMATFVCLNNYGLVLFLLTFKTTMFILSSEYNQEVILLKRG